jgi:hypothetical protein
VRARRDRRRNAPKQETLDAAVEAGGTGEDAVCAELFGVPDDHLLRVAGVNY